MLRPISLLAALLPLSPTLCAQVYRQGPQVVTFYSEIDDSDQPYGLYLPPRFDPSRRYPLVISLHGAESNHRLNLRRVLGRGNLPGETDSEASRYFPNLPIVDYIVASPLARGTIGYRGIAEDDVYAVLDDVRKRFSVDPDRIYLTGLSMGGGGALWLGLSRPGIWAAVAAVCPANIPGTEDLAPNAANLPIHLYHGTLDPVVSVEVSRAWQKRLKDLGVNVDYTEYPNFRHNSWDAAYRNGGAFAWFSKFRRNPFPAFVRFRTAQYKYNSAYWVEITGLTPGTPASIDAAFTGPNSITVRTNQLSGFALHLTGHPMFHPSEPVDITIDGVALKTKFLSFSREGSRWRAQSRVLPAGSKRPGQEGPLAEVLSGRVIFVYGTEGAPVEGELERRRAQAASAANWSTPRARANLALRVASDREVSAWDLEHANLLLFGTRETNVLINRFASQLPFHLNAGAADYGLFYIRPHEGRYLAVSSGLPFDAGVEHTKRIPYRFLPTASVIQSFGDFILFKSSLETVVAEGRFDSQWKTPPEALEKMLATGALQLTR
jgi:pimeloyl-ACP methyl ester carboxylesterase